MPVLAGLAHEEGKRGGEGERLGERDDEVDVGEGRGRHVLVEDVAVSSEHQRRFQHTVVGDVEGVTADAEGLLSVVGEDGIDGGETVGVGGVFQRDGDERRVGRTGAAIDGERGVERLLAVHDGDGVGRDALLRHVDGESEHLGVEGERGGDLDLVEGALDSEEELLLHLGSDVHEGGEGEGGENGGIDGEVAFSTEASGDVAGMEPRSAFVVDGQIAEVHGTGRGVAIGGVGNAEVFHRCERAVEHHLGVAGEDEVHFAVGRFKRGEASVFAPEHLHIEGERHVSLARLGGDDVGRFGVFDVGDDLHDTVVCQFHCHIDWRHGPARNGSVVAALEGIDLPVLLHGVGSVDMSLFIGDGNLSSIRRTGEGEKGEKTKSEVHARDERQEMRM